MIDAQTEAPRLRSSAAPLAAFVVASLAAACLPATADCRYGDSSKPEGAEIHQVNDGAYLCIAGEWIRNNDILAVIAIEKANLWTDCCGSSDETDLIRAACEARPVCALPPADSWAGPDPDPLRRKHLRINYHCALGPKDLPSSHVARQAEGAAPLTLSCRDFTHR